MNNTEIKDCSGRYDIEMTEQLIFDQLDNGVPQEFVADELREALAMGYDPSGKINFRRPGHLQLRF